MCISDVVWCFFLLNLDKFKVLKDGLNDGLIFVNGLFNFILRKFFEFFIVLWNNDVLLFNLLL